MIAQLRVAFKAWLSKRRLIIEFCHDCGRQVDTVWWAADDLWERAFGDDPGPRCQACFEKATTRQGLFVRWWATVD